MPISLRNLFSFRKTTASSNAYSATQQAQAKTKSASVALKRIYIPSKASRSYASRGYTSKGYKSKNYKSIFSRIATSFKIRKERNQNMTQTNAIRKELQKNMTTLQTNVPTQLKHLHDKTGGQEISNDYIENFSTFKKNFTDIDGMTTPSKSIETAASKFRISAIPPSQENTGTQNITEKKSAYSQHLTAFCEGNKNQASRLSVLLTPEAVKTINKQLMASSPKLSQKTTTGMYHANIYHANTDVLIMPDQTARVEITQKFGPLNTTTTINTIIDVPPQETDGPMILKDINITHTD